MINQDFLQSTARALLQVLAGYLAQKGLADADTAQMLVAAGVSVVGLVWSWYTHVAPPSQG